MLFRSHLKSQEQEAWVDACCMVLEPEAFTYLSSSIGDRPMASIMDGLSHGGIVETYRHGGFWTPVETVRDKTLMESLWLRKEAPWKVWED